MTDSIGFTIPIVARGKGSVRTGRGFQYTDKSTKRYMEAIRAAWLAKFPDRKPWDGQITLAIFAKFRIPPSYPKYVRDCVKLAEATGESVACTKKPDWDNIAKAICDALSGLAWKDDAQVSAGVVSKEYTAGDSGIGIKIIFGEDKLAALKASRKGCKK